jgi:hypothetical protein
MVTEKTYDNCTDCPAGGEWPWRGPGLWCFGYAYFFGKSGKPVLCTVVIEKRKSILNKLNAYHAQQCECGQNTNFVQVLNQCELDLT